jgi:predicted acylesterase/phospholipase RssA
MAAGRQLRVALSMRGGVSLAVWIGGATQEIDRVRQAAHHPTRDNRFHTQLLSLAAYESVSIDVITGASAGGLNGVLLAWAMLVGGTLDRLRDLWVVAGDISKLLRREYELGPAPSLFAGDGYFMPALERALASIADDATDQTRRHLQLIAAGTLLRPERVRIGDDESTRADEQRSETYFHVARLGPSRLGLDGFDAADIKDQLALIGRASSSFPVAFEPAKVPHVHGSRIIDLKGRFAEPAGDVPALVIDGGILDNIPVARAIRAVASAAANQPTERVLLFLHPDPSEPGIEADTADDALGVVTSLTSKRSESLLTDIDELRVHNARVTLRSAERDQLLRSFNGGMVPSLDASTRLRGRLDVEAIVRCLMDPAVELPWQPADICRFGRPIDRWDAGGVEALRAALDSTVRDLDAGTSRLGESGSTAPEAARVRRPACRWIPWRRKARPPVRPPATDRGDSWPSLSVGTCRPFEPARRMCRFLIGACRALEEQRFQAKAILRRGDRLGPLKQELYDLQLIAELAASYVMGVAPPLLTTAESGAGTVALEVVGAMRAVGDDIVSSPGLVRAIVAASEGRLMSATVDTGVSGPVHSLASWNRDFFVTEPNGDPRCALRQLWICLDAKARELGALVAEEPDPADPVDRPMLATVIQLSEAPEGTGMLDGLDRTLLPLEARPLPGEQRIRFVRVAGSARSPFDAALAKDGHLPGDILEPSAPLPRRDKLTGSQLFHFGAFLNARWRANDWMWGEMDAAVSVVDLLVTPTVLRRVGSDREVITTLEDLVCADAPAGFSRLLEEWWAAAAHRVTSEIHDVITNGTSDLTNTKRLLIARRHLEILVSRLPNVNATTDEVTASLPAVPACGSVQELEAAMGDYASRRRTIVQELGSTRFTRLGMRTALVAWRVFARPAGRVVGVVAAVLKPVVLAIVGAILATRRTIAAVTVGLTGLVEPWVGGAGPWIAWALAAVVAIVGFGVVDMWRKVGIPFGASSWIPRVVAVGALAFGLWFAVTDQGPYSSPWWFGAIALVVVWLLFSWMKLWALAVTAIVVGGSVVLIRFFANEHPTLIWPARHLGTAFVVSAIATTVLVTYVPVIPRSASDRLGTVRSGVERSGLG